MIVGHVTLVPIKFRSPSLTGCMGELVVSRYPVFSSTQPIQALGIAWSAVSSHK